MQDTDPGLTPPKPETNLALDDSLEQLVPFAEKSYTRATEVFLTDEEAGELTFHVSQNLNFGHKRGRIDVRFSDEENKSIYLRSGDLENQIIEAKIGLRTKVQELLRSLHDEAQEKWFKEVWAAVTNTTEDQAYEVASRLLDLCPFDTIEYTHYSLVDRDLANGSGVAMDWYENMNQTFRDSFPGNTPLISVNVNLPGKEIEFYQPMNGEGYFNIKNPQQEVERKVTETGPVAIDRGDGLSLEIRGDEKFMRYMHAAVQEVRENQELGISKPTEEKMKTLVAALRQVHDLLAAKKA